MANFKDPDYRYGEDFYSINNKKLRDGKWDKLTNIVQTLSSDISNIINALNQFDIKALSDAQGKLGLDVFGWDRDIEALKTSSPDHAQQALDSFYTEVHNTIKDVTDPSIDGSLREFVNLTALYEPSVVSDSQRQIAADKDLITSSVAEFQNVITGTTEALTDIIAQLGGGNLNGIKDPSNGVEVLLQYILTGATSCLQDIQSITDPHGIQYRDPLMAMVVGFLTSAQTVVDSVGDPTLAKSKADTLCDNMDNDVHKIDDMITQTAGYSALNLILIHFEEAYKKAELLIAGWVEGL